MRRRRSGAGAFLVCAATLWGLGAACSSVTADVPDASEAGAEAGADANADLDVDVTADVAVDASSVYAAAVLEDRPIAYWRMNEESGGLVADESGHNHPLELRAASGVGGYSTGQAGATNDGDHSILFDGAKGFATADLGADFPFASAHAFSVELWAAQTTVSTVAAIASGDVAPSVGRSGFVLFSSNGALATARNVDGGGPSATSPTLDLTMFHHVVVTYENGTVTLYVDGNDGIVTTSDGSLTLTGATFAIGRDDGYKNDYYPGRLDEVAVYDHALPDARVRAHHRAGVP